MKENAGRVIAIGVMLVIGMVLLGTCPTSETPSLDPRVLNHQVELVNRSLDTMQEEVAAARVPSRWPFVLFLFSIVAILGAGGWLLWRSERSAIGHDQVIRSMIRVGLKEPVVRAYLDNPGPVLQLPSDSESAPTSTQDCDQDNGQQLLQLAQTIDP